MNEDEYITYLIDLLTSNRDLALGYSLKKRDGVWMLDRVEGDLAGIIALLNATDDQKAAALRHSQKVAA